MTTLLGKALRNLSVQVTKGSRGSLSTYVINAPAQFGQPLPMQSDVYGLITPYRMREIAFKTPTAAACVNAILDFAASVKPKLRNIDASKPVSDPRARLVESILRTPNPQETWKRFVRKLMRDLLRYGYAGVEIEPNQSGDVANLWVLDGQTLKVDFDEHGIIKGFDQMDAHGMPIRGPDGVHGWKSEEVIWFVLDPDSDTVYGTSRIAQIFVMGVIESLMLNYVGTRFTDSNIPFGVYDLGDVSQEEIDFAIENWNKQASKHGDHRIIVGGSKGGAHWQPFNFHLKDLDAANLFVTLRSMIMGEFGVTANELGESQDVNKSNGYNLSFVFKHRALIPLLDEVYDTLSSFLVERRMGIKDVEIGYEEIDSRDDLLQSQIDELQLKSGVTTINAVRNRQGQPNEPGGDELYVFTGSDWIPVSLMFQFSQQQLLTMALMNEQMQLANQAQQMMIESGQVVDSSDPKAGQAQVKPPLLRGKRQPERLGNPNGGSNQLRVHLPQPTPAKGPGTNNQRTRGPVQTMRQQGLRKEEM